MQVHGRAVQMTAMRWHSLGRITGEILYPGLMVTAAVIYWGLKFLRLAVHTRGGCVWTFYLFVKAVDTGPLSSKFSHGFRIRFVGFQHGQPGEHMPAMGLFS